MWCRTPRCVGCTCLPFPSGDTPVGWDLLQPPVCSTTTSLAGFCQLAPRVGVGGGGGEHDAVSPPCKAQPFSWVRAIFHCPRFDEQRQKTQILLSGRSGCICCILGPYVNFFPTRPVTPNSSLDSGDAGAEPSRLHCAWL